MNHEQRATALPAVESAEALALRLIADVLKPRAVPATLSDRTRLHDLGIDSLGVLRLIMLCGEQIGAGASDLEDQLPERLTTVDDLTRLVATLRARA